MIKIVLAGDSHYEYQNIDVVKQREFAADYYLFTGDSQLQAEMIRPFISIRGNNDFASEFPKERILEIEGHKILLLHGNGYITSDMKILASKAKEKGCDVVFYGHTHRFNDIMVDGIRMINPGSLYYNRDFTDPCYAIIELKGNKIDVKRVNL